MKEIDTLIQSYGDWRSQRLQELYDLISMNTELEESFKWGVPVWSHQGLVCAISGFKDHVKMNFLKGAYLNDSKGLFNSGLDSKEHRSINFAESDKIDEKAITELLQQAIAYNEGRK